MKGIERHQIISPGQIRRLKIVFGHNGTQLQAIKITDILIEFINCIAAMARKIAVGFYFINHNITITIF